MILQVFTNDFPCADIQEMIVPDLLHQLIKGSFKDHLVTWVEKYLFIIHDAAVAWHIMDNIDHQYVTFVKSGLFTKLYERITLVPPFTGLRCFHHGHGFKQWTGDDSKALMKVCLIHAYPI